MVQEELKVGVVAVHTVEPFVFGLIIKCCHLCEFISLYKGTVNRLSKIVRTFVDRNQNGHFPFG